MGQAKIIIDMVQCQLLAQAVLVFAQRGDAPSNSGHMLADAQVHALNEGRVDLPTAGREHLPHRLEGAKHDAVAHLHQTPAASGLDDLRVEQLRQRHLSGFGRRALRPLARQVDPLPIVRQQGRRLLREAIGEKQRHTVWRQDLDALMDDPLRHRQGALADVEGQQHLGDRIDRGPYPVGRP